MLERRVVDLDLGDHVVFDDRFLVVEELADLLAATDVFVTPYREQGADRLRRAHVRARRRLRRRLDALLVRERHALVGGRQMVAFADSAASARRSPTYIE